jgi:mRNA-degrading endonuclease RelE of RelBE toxin-antitoxin system
MQDILKQIKKMDLEQVNQIKEAINSRLDLLKDSVRSSLRVGQTVKANHPKVRGLQFRIVKLNNVKVKCVQIYPVTSSKIEYSIPYSFIEAV